MLVRIGILAQSLGVSTSILRRWERKDILVPDMRTAGGHRRSETSPSRTMRPEWHRGKEAWSSVWVTKPLPTLDSFRRAVTLAGEGRNA